MQKKKKNLQVALNFQALVMSNTKVLCRILCSGMLFLKKKFFKTNKINFPGRIIKRKKQCRRRAKKKISSSENVLFLNFLQEKFLMALLKWLAIIYRFISYNSRKKKQTQRYFILFFKLYFYKDCFQSAHLKASKIMFAIISALYSRYWHENCLQKL